MTTKPITLWASPSGPNPWKVAMVLEELGLPYENKFLDISNVKKEPYVSLNPNGRLPTIEDPNTGMTLWESGAIIEYLVGTYDDEGKISSKSGPEVWLEKQWLHFQMSGQGPYFGQAVWFIIYHPEKVPSAVERYYTEIRRVISVLDLALKGKEYLVGNKVSYADISFFAWQIRLDEIFQTKEEVDKLRDQYPAWAAWNDRVLARPAIAKTVADHRAAIAEQKK